jgi:hypothetical protein
MTSRRSLPIALAGLSIAIAALPAQTQTGNLLTATPIAKVSAKRGESFMARLSLTLQPGLHVHSNKPNDEYLIPIKLTWQADPLKVEAIEFPKPKEERGSFSDKPLSVFDGSFDIVTRFTSAASAPAGLGFATGKLRYQACNDRMCFPPKTIDVKMTYDLR